MLSVHTYIRVTNDTIWDAFVYTVCSPCLIYADFIIITQSLLFQLGEILQLQDLWLSESRLSTSRFLFQIVDGESITAIRTGIASAVATKVRTGQRHAQASKCAVNPDVQCLL